MRANISKPEFYFQAEQINIWFLIFVREHFSFHIIGVGTNFISLVSMLFISLWDFQQLLDYSLIIILFKNKQVFKKSDR